MLSREIMHVLPLPWSASCAGERKPLAATMKQKRVFPNLYVQADVGECLGRGVINMLHKTDAHTPARRKNGVRVRVLAHRVVSPQGHSGLLEKPVLLDASSHENGPSQLSMQRGIPTLTRFPRKENDSRTTQERLVMVGGSQQRGVSESSGKLELICFATGLKPSWTSGRQHDGSQERTL
jgi:hypothetical protein